MIHKIFLFFNYQIKIIRVLIGGSIYAVYT